MAGKLSFPTSRLWMYAAASLTDGWSNTSVPGQSHLPQRLVKLSLALHCIGYCRACVCSFFPGIESKIPSLADLSMLPKMATG